MDVRTYDTIDESRDRWEAALAGFPDADVYFFPGYAAACEIAGDGEAVCFHATERERQGLEVLMVRPVDGLDFLDGERTGRLDAVSPYGYSGPLFSVSAATNPAFRVAYTRALSEWAAERGIVGRFVRFHPLLENAEAMRGLMDVREIQPTVYMDLAHLDDPAGGFASSAARLVRQAERAGIVVRELAPAERLREFVDLYESTMRRVDARGYYYFPWEYYEALGEGLGHRLRLLGAFAGDELASAALFLTGGRYAHYHLGASSAEHLSLRPNNLLFAEAGRMFKREGHAALHLGGGVSGEDSLFRFKKGLATGRSVFCGGREVIDPAAYGMLVDRWERWAGEKADPRGFFPAYRAPRGVGE